MHHPTNRIAHTTAFVTPVVEHWLEREITQWVRYLGLKGLTPMEIHEDMVVTHGENAPSYSMVKKWDAELKQDRDSLEENPHRRRPVTSLHRRPLPRFITSSWKIDK